MCVREVLLHMNNCGDKTHNNEPASILQFVLPSIVVPVVASRKKPHYISEPTTVGVPIFFVKRCSRRHYNGHPALLLHGPYRKTTTTNIRTSTYTGIHSFHRGTNTRCTAAVLLSPNSCHCPEIMSTNIMPRQARPVEQTINSTITF